MLRPNDQEWFHMGLLDDEDRLDTEGKQYLEWVTRGMRKGMSYHKTQFSRATKQGDHDFSAFGGCVLSCDLSSSASHLLYRNYHLKDCAWEENADGEIGFFARKENITYRNLVSKFGSAVDQKITDKVSKQPFEKVKCYHFMCEADYYDEDPRGMPYWSIWYDAENDKPLHVTPVRLFKYIIPRWQTVSGSQYPFSPATIVALPDARLIQAISLTLLEAGEKAVNPPLVGTSDVIKSDVALYAGGLTWIDQEYDQRTGQALQPLNQDLRGLPFGFEMQADQREMIKKAFYLDRLALPVNAPEMTAYEVGQRVQQYIREAMPIFQPMEDEYNGRLCDMTFQQMLLSGAFGNPRYNMPRSLSGREYRFHFESPLHDAIEQQKGQQFLEAKALLAEAAQFDGAASYTIDIKEAVRDSLHGIGIPAKWMRTEMQVEQIESQRQEAKAQQQQMEVMEQNSQIAANIANAKTA
jgi:hypothetical protein